MNDETETCPECGEEMMPVYENVGFFEPDPTYLQLAGFECTNCGHKEEL